MIEHLSPVDDMTYEWLDASNVSRIRELDRSEHIVRHYEMEGSSLEAETVDWDIPNWHAEGEGDHSIQSHINFCADHMNKGGVLRGAFSAGVMVGVGLLRPEIRKEMAQLAFLHVSRAYRRRGIAHRLVQDLTDFSIKSGEKRMYVSATPSGSAVGFYTSHGFEPTDKPLEDLFALEPEDIHMIKELPTSD